MSTLSRLGNEARWRTVLPSDLGEEIRQTRRWAWALRRRGRTVELLYDLPREQWIRILKSKGLV